MTIIKNANLKQFHFNCRAAKQSFLYVPSLGLDPAR